jgi:CRP/FNR family cyclic AMP-dependent transcriptional regulator
VAKIKPLKENELFQSLNDKEIALLSKSVEEKVLPSNTPLFFENMIGESMYIVVNGAIKISKMLSEGEERTLTVMEPGDYFGEMALLEEGPRTVSAIVQEQADVLVFKRNAFLEMMTKEPQLAVKVIASMYKSLSSKLRQASPRIQEIVIQKTAKPGG